MSQEIELSLYPPIWPAVTYFIVSITVFLLLYLGKLKVNKLRRYPLFIAYALLVIAIAAVQINIFANGYDFVSVFLHIDFDPYRYDSVYWGALFFSMLYLLAMPRNKY
ncbi:hypothetical protein [Citrobacter sp. R56]|uniref:hypothetical protein n=1 Tax=Citrobacter sp. R56 TaxID=1573676 RepID=UPI00193C039B|nr:hypothetical protein [Citrobacter sp. R56]QRG78301.1 hypothetical protein JM656_17075 [Citrobacter sp. R56]